MPEMVRLIVGRRYTVSRRVDKICDTVSGSGSRRTYSTVYLEDLRCDGSGHDGCQAACRIYWKDAWLRRVDDHSNAVDPGRRQGMAELERLAQAGTRTVRKLRVNRWRPGAARQPTRWKFSEPLKTLQTWPQYWREFRNGNFPFRFIRLLARGLRDGVASRTGLAQAAASCTGRTATPRVKKLGSAAR